MKKFAKILIALVLVTPILVACADGLEPDTPKTETKGEKVELPIFHETIMPDDLPK